MPIFLFAHIDTDLARIESGLFSKMIFLDYDYKDKLIDGKVVIYILYDSPEHEEIAEEFVNFLNNKDVLNTTISAKKCSYNSFKRELPTAYITILEEKNMKKISNKLIYQERLVFASDKSLIGYAMVSIYLGSRIMPIINPKLIKEGNIELRPIIFKVAKVYGDDED
jgi:hypothetical protein